MKNRWLSLLAIAVLLYSCKSMHIGKRADDDKHFPVKKILFLEKPFGYIANEKSLTEHLVPPFKVQRFVVLNAHDPKQSDTIIKFRDNKTELLVYKTKFKQELFLGGNVKSNNVSFCNGVKVGMPRGAFFNCFTDLKYSDDDTVKIKSIGPGATCKFAFKKNKLTTINIQYYFD